MPRSKEKRYWSWRAKLPALIALAAGVAATSIAGDPPARPPVIAPEAAVEYAGKQCVIEMQVRSARRGENPIVFLNSEKAFAAPRILRR